MPYIGRSNDKISNVEILTNLVFDGSSSYSITKNSVPFTPNSAQSLLISIDGVVQATNFSVNSSTIDFGVAIPSTSVCNFFLHYGTGVMTVPSDGSVTTAKLGDSAVTTAKITDANVTSAKMFSGFANGITMADQWRLTTSTNGGVNTDITTNWERVDDTSWSGIGTGLTESSGVFSFAQTGIYLISGNFVIYVEAGDAAAGVALETTNDNSTFLTDAIGYAGNEGSVAAYGMASFQQFFNVENVTNYKFKFSSNSFSGATVIIAGSNNSISGFTVTRLGDSV